jgi:Glucose-6-phosphate dehydrogenase, NAD binding domain
MSNAQSDALVFFGATGDLAYKKIFPALHAMAKRGHLDVPVAPITAGSATSPDYHRAAGGHELLPCLPTSGRGSVDETPAGGRHPIRRAPKARF